MLFRQKLDLSSAVTKISPKLNFGLGPHDAHVDSVIPECIPSESVLITLQLSIVLSLMSKSGYLVVNAPLSFSFYDVQRTATLQLFYLLSIDT